MDAGGDSRQPGTPGKSMIGGPDDLAAFVAPLAPDSSGFGGHSRLGAAPPAAANAAFGAHATPHLDIRPSTGWSALKMLSVVTAALAIIAIAMVATAGGSSSPAGKPYSAAVAQQFTTGCEAHTPASWSQSTASSYCEAALSCIEAHLSYAQLMSVDESIVDGRVNPDVEQVQLCTQSALRSTPGTGSLSAT
jgi:hypothetical protein